MRKLIVGITGATGSILAVRLLEALAETSMETHLVVSKWAQQTTEHETSLTLDDLRGLATHAYGASDMAAKISSGSFQTDGMVVVPCSMRTVACIAHGTGENLIHRAADVILKERRKLVLVPRETPFNDIHLENMLKLSRMGVGILPPMPAFYNKPETLDDMVDHIVMRILDQFEISSNPVERWNGDLRGRASTVHPIKLKNT